MLHVVVRRGASTPSVALTPPAPAAVLLLASREAGRALAARHLHATDDATGCPVGVTPARPSPGLPAPWVRLEGVLDYIVAEGSDTYLLVRDLHGTTAKGKARLRLLNPHEGNESERKESRTLC